MNLQTWKNKYRIDEIPFYWKPVIYGFSYLVGILWRTYFMFVHYTSEIEIATEPSLNRSSAVYCHWHAYIPVTFCVFLRPHKHVWLQHPMWYMKPIQVLLQLYGIKNLFGSAGHNGREAADRLSELLTQGYSTMIFPDGPNGPPRKLKHGVLHIAAQSNVPVVPIRYRVGRSITTSSWDKKIFPLPFSKITVEFGAPMVIDRVTDAVSERLERALHF